MKNIDNNLEFCMKLAYLYEYYCHAIANAVDITFEEWLFEEGYLEEDLLV